ncbi:EcsC family protein [Acidocella sp.]|uniref:EcsC family protein n=1 Tax=Acidocella sp. TaxID=50710 RepID=UPI00261A61DA|nr:EcsC family protein [Acidocella sp.]
MDTHDGDEGQAGDAGRLTQILDTIWNEIVLGDSKLSPEKSCFELANDYRHSGKTPDECAENFIGWQTAKAGAAGFVLGLPGFAAMPVTVPADFMSVAYLQLRMVAVVGLLFGWDVRSDQFRTMAYLSLLGSAAGELVRDLGIKATTRIAMGTIQKKVSGAVLQKINRAVGTRLVTKAGSTGVVNLTKVVPVLGGLVGGGVNVLVTRQIGKTAVSWLREGPAAQGEGGPDAPEGDIIEGEIE